MATIHWLCLAFRSLQLACIGTGVLMFFFCKKNAENLNSPLAVTLNRLVAFTLNLFTLVFIQLNVLLRVLVCMCFKARGEGDPHRIQFIVSSLSPSLSLLRMTLPQHCNCSLACVCVFFFKLLHKNKNKNCSYIKYINLISVHSPRNMDRSFYCLLRWIVIPME